MKRVVREVEHFEGGNVAEERRDGAVEEIIDQREDLEFLEAAESVGNFSGEIVAGEVEVLEVGEVW